MPASRRKPPPVAEPPAEEDILQVEERTRTPKFKKMEFAVQGFYVMLGGALSVLPNEVAGQQFKRIGKSFALHSDEIAEAWIDLAEDDARVRRIIESVTGFSTWGKVIGRHLEAIGDETPAIQGLRAAQQGQPIAQPDMSDAMAIADFLAQAAAAERVRQQGNGAEEDVSGLQAQAVQRQMQQDTQQRRQRRPMRQQQQQPDHPMGMPRQPQQQPQQVSQPEQAPAMGQTRKPVGMPTPADLGVTFADAPEDFPAPGVGGEADVKG